jgi:MerR family regulatory protein
MRIGELAERSGLAASRIRFYEQRGLISAVVRNAQLLAIIETIESKPEGLTCDDNKRRVLKRFRKRSASL